MLTDADRVPLSARAWIADGTRGALVAADGTIDWYCPGGFEREPALWRLLDPAGAAVRVGPVREAPGATRRLPAGAQGYRPDTMVSTTTLRAADGVLLVEDALLWSGGSITPTGRLVRVATALAGPLEVEVEVLPGRCGSRERTVETWSEGVTLGALSVWAGTSFDPAPLGRDLPRWRAVRRLDAGESLVVTLDPAGSPGAPLSVGRALRLLDETAAAWRSWLAPFALDGQYSSAARRAALTLRSLTGPGGAPLAAGTTSLPRRPGGERTADDRVCRLRDAAAAARSLAVAGMNEDAEAAERWAREAVETSGPPWPVQLAADGGPPPERREVPLSGWRGGQPVVFGSSPGTGDDEAPPAPRSAAGPTAAGPTTAGPAAGPGDGPAGRSVPGVLADLDLCADVELAVSASHRGPWGDRGPGPLAGAPGALAAGADWVADHWELPDAGVWALSGRPARLVASTLQAWVCLDRAARRARAIDPLDLPAAGWQAEARRVLAWIESEAVGADGALRRSVPAAGDGGTRREAGSGDDESDAALLRVAWKGPWPSGHPVVAATVGRVLERQASGLLVYRLPEGADDGRPGPDSPDLLSSLWAVRALARLGRWEEANERMEAALGFARADGPLAEAADPATGEMYGNLPSAAVHLAVIDAACELASGPR